MIMRDPIVGGRRKAEAEALGGRRKAEAHAPLKKQFPRFRLWSSAFYFNSGFTLVEIMIVVGIIGLLAAVAVPNFIQTRNYSRSSICINNLRLIDAAKEQYALEWSLQAGTATTSTDCTPYLKQNTFPVCPGTPTAYATNAIGFYPTCALAGAAAGASPKSHRLD